VDLSSHADGQPKDATTRRCAAAADSRSRVAYGLTRGGRQPVSWAERLFGLNIVVEIKYAAKIE
jgi:hypothetical protein